MAKLTPARVVVDVVNGWDEVQWKMGGYKFTHFGSPVV
jgi:hypothetical protein